MERGFYKNNGDAFYRYLDAKLLIKEPSEFSDDGFAIVDAAIVGDDFKLPVHDIDPGFSVVPEPIAINDVDPGFSVVPEPIATNDVDPGFTIVPEPLKTDLFQKIVIDKKGNFMGRDPLHNGNVVKVREGIIYYDNGVLKPFLPTDSMIWAIKEDSIKEAMEKFIIGKIDKFSSDGWEEKDIDDLKKYFDHESSEQFLYDVANNYFGDLAKQGETENELKEIMVRLQKQFEILKEQNRAEMETKITKFSAIEREPSAE